MRNRQNTVMVIGAGLAGVLTARELAAQGYYVLLLEATKEILSQTSFNNSYRLHTGMHYIGDLETAKLCLKSSYEFAKEFEDCLMGKGKEPWRRGRYYFMSNSTIPKNAVLNAVNELKNDYTVLVQNNAGRELFGDTAEFIKEISESEHNFISKKIPFINEEKPENKIEEIQVSFAFETSEPQIDIEKLKKKLQHEITANASIQLITGASVRKISQNHDASFLVEVVENEETYYFDQLKYVVNCAWQNIELIERNLFLSPPIQRVNRVKLSVLVELPESLETINTCLFSVGPHCSITNLSARKAIITYEPLTNQKTSDAIQPPEFPSDAAQQALGKAIIIAASTYIPLLADAKLLEVHCGFVRMPGCQAEDISIYNPTSLIHKRASAGAESRSAGYFINAGTKLSYCLQNAKFIAGELRKHEKIMRMIERKIQPIRNPTIKDAQRLYHMRYMFTLFNPGIINVCASNPVIPLSLPIRPK